MEQVSFPGDELADRIVIEPGGRHLHVTEQRDSADDVVVGYSINTATGALSAAGSAITEELPLALTFTP